MMNNCKYDKVKIVSELSCLAWFLEKHARTDAQQANDTHCLESLNNLKKDLEKHISIFEELLCKNN